MRSINDTAATALSLASYDLEPRFRCPAQQDRTALGLAVLDQGFPILLSVRHGI